MNRWRSERVLGQLALSVICVAALAHGVPAIAGGGGGGPSCYDAVAFSTTPQQGNLDTCDFYYYCTGDDSCVSLSSWTGRRCNMPTNVSRLCFECYFGIWTEEGCKDGDCDPYYDGTRVAFTTAPCP